MKLRTFGTVVLAMFILQLIYVLEGRFDLAALAIAVSLIWIIGLWRGWAWSAHIGFVGLIGATAVGAWLGMSPVGMLVALITTLIAWDLHRFLLRLSKEDYVMDMANLQAIHLRRLAIVAGIGLVSGVMALSLEFNLGLGWVILIGLMVAIGLSWIVGFVT